jgi:hypothetical protein
VETIEVDTEDMTDPTLGWPNDTELDVDEPTEPLPRLGYEAAIARELV